MRNLSLSMDTIVFLTNDFFVFNLKNSLFQKQNFLLKVTKFHGYFVKHENARTEKLRGGGLSNDPPPPQPVKDYQNETIIFQKSENGLSHYLHYTGCPKKT